MPSRAYLHLACVLVSSLACGNAPPDGEESAECAGAKCDDAEAQDEPCTGVDPSALGCCWIGSDDAGSDALICAFSSESAAPASMAALADRFDPDGVIQDRVALADTGEATVAWSIPEYPIEIGIEVVADGEGVVGLERGVSGLQRFEVSSREALTEASPLVVEAPVDVWATELLNRYPDEVARLGFSYELEGAHEGTIVVDTERAVARYGVRESLAVAVPPGTAELPVRIQLVSVTETTEGTSVDSKLVGAGPYTLDETGLVALGPDDLVEPVGDPVTTCSVERSMIPAPEDCVADDAEPDKCDPEIVDELVCTLPDNPAVEAVLVDAQGTAPEDGPESGPVSLVVGADARARLDPAAYPYRLDFEVLLATGAVVGLDTLEDASHRASAVIDGPSGKADLTLPFETWDVTLAVEPDIFAFVQLAPWNIELGFGREDRFALLARDEELEVFETPTSVVMVVAPGTESVRASVELDRGVLEHENPVVEVEIRPGSWLVTEAGLEPVQ